MRTSILFMLASALALRAQVPFQEGSQPILQANTPVTAWVSPDGFRKLEIVTGSSGLMLMIDCPPPKPVDIKMEGANGFFGGETWQRIYNGQAEWTFRIDGKD